MINDEQLLALLLDDSLPADQRRQLEQAIAADPELRRRLTAWQAPLRTWPADDSFDPAPAAAQARWRRALAREQRLTASSDRRWPQGWLVAGLATIVLATFALSLERWRLPPTGAAQQPPPVAQDSAETGALQRGVALYLADTRARLAQWPGSADQQHDLLAQSLAQNRLYAAAAAAQGDQELARVLRAFELTLESLQAARDNDPAAAATRQRLSFELGAMQTKLSPAASKQTHTL